MLRLCVCINSRKLLFSLISKLWLVLNVLEPANLIVDEEEQFGDVDTVLVCLLWTAGKSKEVALQGIEWLFDSQSHVDRGIDLSGVVYSHPEQVLESLELFLKIEPRY